MNLVVIGDNHGDIENMISYLEKLELFNFDALIYVGDFTDLNPPRGYTQEDITKILIEELKTTKKPIFAVPGNNDVKEVLKLIEKNNISVHGKGSMFGEYGFYGFGGAKTPFATPFEPTEEEIRNGLEKGFNEVKTAKYKIQITHNPPYGTYLDMTRGGLHVGSKIIRNFIEEKKPLVSFCGHIHESRGIDKIGDCFVVNPGKFTEGHFALVGLNGNKADIKLLNLTD